MTFAGKVERVWRPTQRLLRAGQAVHAGSALSWELAQLRLPGLPLVMIECTMTGMGEVADGLGDGLTFKAAAVRAIAEAWERLTMQRLAREAGRRISSSNGFAAGRTEADARAGARGESIEREVMLRAWRSQRGWRPHRLQAHAARLMGALLRQRGWRLDVYALEAPEGHVLAGVGRHPELGAAFDCGHVVDGKLVPSAPNS
jgi:ribosomal protein S12 methylthiotransferase accessory factor YcaO